MKTETIRQTVVLPANPKQVYDAWTDAKKHSQVTRGTVTVSKRKGAAFAVFDGWAQGRNVELVDGKKIVQQWRADEEGWPQDHFSKITITLKAKGSATELSFVQEGVPAECAERIAQGWKDYYWKPLESFLKK